MFNIPTLPFDSLYKFLFISGILLIITSNYYSYKTTNNHAALMIANDSTATYNNIERGRLKDSITMLSKSTKEYVMHLQAYLTTFKLIDEGKIGIRSKDKNRLLDSMREVDYFLQLEDKTIQKNNLLFDGVIRKKLNLDVRSIELKTRLEISKIMTELDLKLFSKISWLGIFIFVLGGVLWFFKIQKPQDELLKLQLFEAKKKATISGRAHFEPKILPRQEVRNRY